MNKKQELTYQLHRLCEFIPGLEIIWGECRKSELFEFEVEEVVLSVKDSASKIIQLYIPKDALMVHYVLPYAEGSDDSTLAILLEACGIYLQSKGLLINLEAKDTDKFIEKIKAFFNLASDELLEIFEEARSGLK